ncbi:hypothetical protein ACET9H_20875 [Aeromonas media]|uniref:hypothetical protein n=1 Tax=Aeromonas media TaxID=651 RepID=UPI0038CF8461
MKFVVIVREIDLPDLGQGFHLLPIEDEHEMYLTSFHQDLIAMEIFSTVQHSYSEFHVDTIEPITQSALYDRIERCINESYYRYMVLVNVKPV